MSKLTALTKKYEDEIMESLKPLFKSSTTKEDIAFYKSILGCKLINLKMETSKLVIEEVSKVI